MLTAVQRAALARHESVIEAGLQSFVQVGTALLHIRDERLYRATHRTFEDYLAERWHISRPRGYELMNAAATATAMSGIPDIPQIENTEQAKAIAPIAKDHGPEAAAEVLRQVADEGKVTAAAIREKAKPRRRPLPDVFRETTRDITKMAERLQRLTIDDRMPQHREHLPVGDLERAIRTLLEVLGDLQPPQQMPAERMTPAEFAALGIPGLDTEDSVVHYLEAWESTGLPRPVPGETVSLPTIPFPVEGVRTS